jgi:DNA-binding response OmpR family regulator
LRRRIIFVTGDILSREKREFLERTGAPYLLKPFDLREVRQVVHRMLADAGADPRPESAPGLR